MQLLLLGALLAPCVLAVKSTVQLDYATYKGNVLASGVSEWLGMRYAAPPTGDLRFAAPQDPVHVQHVQDATFHGARCIGLGQQPNRALGEDCLFIDVFAPTKATQNSSLPVYFFIQGGGFNTDSNANYNGSALLLAADNKMLIVTFNYRVASLGFLASKEVQAGASVNNGLKDQRKALQWVQDNIHKFGGDPNHVVLGGDSAGAASITLHLTAYGGRNDNLFHGTAAESQSFGPVLTVAESQYQYDSLLQNSGCEGKADTLACLRALNLRSFQKAARNVAYPGQGGPPLYMYNPVIDGDFVREMTMRAFQKGHFLKLPAIYGDTSNEGTLFCPRRIGDMQTSTTWLSWQFPYLNGSHLDAVSRYFPRTNDNFPRATDFWRQCSNAYGSIRYLCPGLQLSALYAASSTPIWTYLWNVEDPGNEQSGLGVFHTAEINAIWTPGVEGTRSFWPKSYLPGGVNEKVIPVVQGYWISFIRNLDPNVERGTGTGVWEQWAAGEVSGEGTGARRLVFSTDKTAMADVDKGTREACGYFATVTASNQQ